MPRKFMYLLYVVFALILAVQGDVKKKSPMKTSNTQSSAQKKKSCNTCSCGMPGIPGTHGIPGSPGAEGRPGLAGTRGAKGDPGKRGYPGPVGPVGAVGKEGYSGEDGPTGDPGMQGKIGPRGKSGFPGISGSKGRKGEPAKITSLYNWKQCVWNRDDTITRTDNRIQECTFIKKHQYTALRVGFHGNLGSDTGCTRWFFKFNNVECLGPVPIEAMVQSPNSVMPIKTNHHSIEGYCTNIPSGTVRVALWVGECKDTVGNHRRNAYCGRKSISRIVIEEVSSSQ